MLSSGRISSGKNWACSVYSHVFWWGQASTSRTSCPGSCYSRNLSIGITILPSCMPGCVYVKHDGLRTSRFDVWHVDSNLTRMVIHTKNYISSYRLGVCICYTGIRMGRALRLSRVYTLMCWTPSLPPLSAPPCLMAGRSRVRSCPQCALRPSTPAAITPAITWKYSCMLLSVFGTVVEGQVKLWVLNALSLISFDLLGPLPCWIT